MNRLRRLTESDRPLIEHFLADKLDSHIFVAERLLSRPSEESIVLAIGNDSTIDSMLYLSGNAVPISLNIEMANLYAKTAYVKYAQIASIVGIDGDVEYLWSAIANTDTSRTIRSKRESQPYMLLDNLQETPSGISLRYITSDDFEQYFDASHSMFLGEVGREPINLENYKARLYEQIVKKRSIGYFDDEGILRFKVDVPICYNDVCQVQGVWLHPQWRGQGRSSALFTEALSLIQRDIAPRVTLYVNDFNQSALKLYLRVGFKEIERYSTIFLDI